MPWHYSRKLIPYAKENRSALTPAERKLWFEFLRHHPAHFRKQRPFKPFIADFYCAGAKLVIEVDGAGHYTPEGQAYDAARTAHLEGLGLKVLRFSNAEVLDGFEVVCGQIEGWVKARGA
jgi:very-short-patch-repair endonuclease